jgi:hypothetical protein
MDQEPIDPVAAAFFIDEEQARTIRTEAATAAASLTTHEVEERLAFYRSGQVPGLKSLLTQAYQEGDPDVIAGLREKAHGRAEAAICGAALREILQQRELAARRPRRRPWATRLYRRSSVE